MHRKTPMPASTRVSKRFERHARQAARTACERFECGADLLERALQSHESGRVDGVQNNAAKGGLPHNPHGLINRPANLGRRYSRMERRRGIHGRIGLGPPLADTIHATLAIIRRSMIYFVQKFLAHFTYVALILILFATGMGVPLPEDIPLITSGYLCNKAESPLTQIPLVDTNGGGIPDTPDAHFHPHV